jgi:hypothetical protein
LQLARANALISLKGYAAPGTIEAFTEAKLPIDDGVETDLQRYSVLYGLWGANYVAARVEPALMLARQFVDVADQQADTTYQMVGHRVFGMVCLSMGRNREGLQHLTKAVSYRDPVRHKSLSYWFGWDPGLAALSYRIWALNFLGSPDQAVTPYP